MNRLLTLVYGIASYALGMAGLTYFMLFVGSWDFLPWHVDSGSPGGIGNAVATNLGLICLFGLSHSIMARPGFKQLWTKVVPPAVERSTYVLVSGIMMCVICYFWKALPGTAWTVDNSSLRVALVGLQLFGWGLAVSATFVINHFEVFGLQQVYFHFRNQPEPATRFVERSFYKIVRHPLQLGVLIGLWATPVMSMTHLMLSATMTIYILVGLYFEERDLAATLGENYTQYQERVRMLVPIPKRTRSRIESAATIQESI